MIATKQQPAIKSSARQLLDLVWEHNREATGFSWQRLNSSMYEAVILAINAGMEFAPGDFTEIYEDFRGHYWFGTDNDHSQGERFYSQAIKMMNLSACQSFENWKERPPFINEGKRLCIGSSFDWVHKNQTYYVTVTSFSKNEQSLIACTYKPRPEDSFCESCHRVKFAYAVEKIAKRFKITIEELRAFERTIEKAKKAAKPTASQEVSQ